MKIRLAAIILAALALAGALAYGAQHSAQPAQETGGLVGEWQGDENGAPVPSDGVYGRAQAEQVVTTPDGKGG